MENNNLTNRKPSWLRVHLSGGGNYRQVKDLVDAEGLHTVCQSARCPNLGDCWSRRTATFMILGDICTRNCRFCAVVSGKPEPADRDEPQRVADAVCKLKLRHAVITSVTRDDLADGGASFFTETILAIRLESPGCSIEVLIPDFQGNTTALQYVFSARPDILNHNLEVVPHLYQEARAGADFNRSLNILREASAAGLVSKTGIMLGLGETQQELSALFDDLAGINLNILTLGQYLQPGKRHLPVQKYYHPEEFLQLKEQAEKAGIHYVESGPLVRSSWHADQQLPQLKR
ncbi:MAG: lipoyl synthase [Calditrichia bacterium]